MFKNQNLVFIKADCIFFNNSKHIQARGTRQYIDPSRSRNTYKATSRDALLLSDFKTSRDSHTLAYSRPPRFLNTNFFLFRWIKVISRTKRRLIPTKPSQDVSSCGDVKPEKKDFLSSRSPLLLKISSKIFLVFRRFRVYRALFNEAHKKNRNEINVYRLRCLLS